MSTGKLDHEVPEITAENVVGTLRCANPDCSEPVLQAHTFSMGIFRVLACSKCGRASEYRSLPSGWTCVLLPTNWRKERDKAPKRAAKG